MSGLSCLKEAYVLVGVTGYPQNVVGGTSQNQENKGVVKAGTRGWVSREGFLEKEGFDLALKQDLRLHQPQTVAWQEHSGMWRLATRALDYVH